jgi:hypothetical protein
MTEFSTVTSNGRTGGSRACPLQTDSVVSALPVSCPTRSTARRKVCIWKVMILRAANGNWLGETSPLLHQRFRRQLSREGREKIEKARGFFSRSFSKPRRRPIESYARYLGRGGSMSELSAEELSIAPAGADPGRRKAAAQEARGALGALRRRRVAFATAAGSEKTCKDAKGETNPSGQRPGSRRRHGPVRDGDRVLRYLSKYMEAEVEAHRARRGIWQGEFVEPEKWRYRQ